MTYDDEEDSYARRQEELRRHAHNEGAWYYDPESPTIWKRFILGPVPLWKRIWWHFYPPTFFQAMEMSRKRGEKMLIDAWKDKIGG